MSSDPTSTEIRCRSSFSCSCKSGEDAETLNVKRLTFNVSAFKRSKEEGVWGRGNASGAAFGAPSGSVLSGTAGSVRPRTDGAQTSALDNGGSRPSQDGRPVPSRTGQPLSWGTGAD